MLCVQSYLGFCGVTISLLVFLNATQPFVLSQVFGLKQNGAVSGVLALVDEVLILVLAPIWGALSDKIGTRYCAVLGLWIMAASLAIYPRVPSVYPGLLLARMLFSFGASSCVAMIAAALAELSLLASTSTNRDSRSPFSDASSASSINSQAGEATLLFAGRADEEYSARNEEREGDGDDTVPLFEAPINDELFDTMVAAPRPNGKLAGLSGFASAVGAVFAVSVLLPLPTSLSSNAKEGFVQAYSWVSLGTALAGLIFLLTLYQNPARGLRSFFAGSNNVSIFDEAAVDAGGSVMTYLQLLADGFTAAQSDKRLQVAYLGSLVARATSVVLALFVPLWVNQWYYDHGKCSYDDPNGCRDAVRQAAILTGIANTVMLPGALAVGWAGDRFGSVKVLAWSAMLGLLTMIGLVLSRSPLGAVAILLSALIGLAQIGLITMSMSMSTDKRRVAGGSVAGAYSFFGSLGVLVVTQFWAPLSDLWIKTPFVVMGVLCAILFGFSSRLALSTALRSMRSSITLG